MEYRHRAVTPELPDPTDWLPYLDEAYRQNWYTNFGPVNTRFEARLTKLYARGDETVVTAANATAGLTACLISEAISGPVLCPAFTFQATAAAILGANCAPLIIDVDLDSGVISPKSLEQSLITSGAKAAVVLAPYGIATNFKAHEKICQRLNRLLIIDNAAGLGISRGNISFTGAGEVVREVYSLHATKPFGVGEGAAIFTPHSKAERLRAALNFGLQTHTVVGTNAPPFWGINGKMSEFHAAIGLAVADKMEVRVAQRQAMAENWIKCLETTPVKILNRSVKDATWQVFPILMDTNYQAEQLVNLAKYRGIELRRYYSPSLGACPGIRKLSFCPNAQSLAGRVVVLPIRSLMEEALQQELMNEIRACIMQIFESSTE